MDAKEIRELTEAYLSVYEEVDTRRAPKELVARLSASTEGHMAQDGPNKDAYDAKQRLLKKASERRNKLKEQTDSYDLDERFTTADTGKIATQAGRKEREYNDPDYKTLDTATRHLSASKTKPPSSRNLMRRDAQMAILRARIAAGHEAIGDMITAANKSGRKINNDPELRDAIMKHAANTSKAEQRRRSIQTVKNMQTRRTPEQQAAQSNASRLYDTYVKSESYDFYDLVLEYLINEGYADTVENAEKIMCCMSEEWINTILESDYDWKKHSHFEHGQHAAREEKRTGKKAEPYHKPGTEAAKEWKRGYNSIMKED
jgi:hypothetical protein